VFFDVTREHVPCVRNRVQSPHIKRVLDVAGKIRKISSDLHFKVPLDYFDLSCGKVGRAFL
jgi:hypothetical protein